MLTNFKYEMVLSAFRRMTPEEREEEISNFTDYVREKDPDILVPLSETCDALAESIGEAAE